MPRAIAPGWFQSLGPFQVPGFPERSVRIYVPAGYQKSQPRAALYLLDGQNVFEDEGSFSGGWHTHTAIDGLTGRRVVPAPIVVAIPHGVHHRQDELTPWPMGGKGGASDRFLDWIAGDLVPAVQSAFAIIPGPVGSAIGGASWGGLCALYAHFRHPDLFGGALCLSPSFWVAYPSAFEWIAQRPTPPISRVYIDCGGREAGGRMLPMARRMAELLAARGYPRGQLLWRPDPRGDHNEAEWRRRLPRALRFMYRR